MTDTPQHTRLAEPVILGPCSLYHGEQSEVIAHLQANGTLVDHVITDPPYDDKTHKGALTNKGGNGSNGGNVLVSFQKYSGEEFMQAVRGALGIANGWVVLTCAIAHVELARVMPEFIRLGAWVKLNPMPQITGDRPGQGFEPVVILHSGKVKKSWNRGGGSAVWHDCVVDKATVATEKPLSLICKFVNDFTQEGETILDSHMGSGTTAIACIRTGRRFIGIEKDVHHFKIARDRISKELEQGLLWGSDPVGVPVDDGQWELPLEGSITNCN